MVRVVGEGFLVRHYNVLHEPVSLVGQEKLAIFESVGEVGVEAGRLESGRVMGGGRVPDGGVSEFPIVVANRL